MTALMLCHFCWSLTRRIGFTAYAVTSLGGLWAWASVRRSPDEQRRREAGLALLISIVECLFALDMVFEWRIMLHTFWADLFMKYNLYNQRHTIQLDLLFVLGCALLLVLTRAFFRFRSRKGSLLAVAGLSMSLTVWAMEIISLHETDSGLYHMVNDVMVIAILWVIACLLTLLGVGIAARMPACKIGIGR